MAKVQLRDCLENSQRDSRLQSWMVPVSKLRLLGLLLWTITAQLQGLSEFPDSLTTLLGV